MASRLSKPGINTQLVLSHLDRTSRMSTATWGFKVSGLARQVRPATPDRDEPQARRQAGLSKNVQGRTLVTEQI